MNRVCHTDTGLSYTGVALDRAGARRADAEWIHGLLDNADTRIVPVWRNRNLITGLGDAEGPRPVILTDRLARDAVEAAAETVFLGLAYGRGMITWHRNHQFCGRCGGPMESRHGGHLRCCIRTDCGHESYPRTDPAVIMVVEHIPEDGGPPQCLLGRQANWPEGSYSTLAGFVEPGESLEETVIREIAEEAGVCVQDVRYIASQPWPFPASIMLGFWARAESTEIRIDPNELEDAGWYTPEAVRTFGQWGSGGPGPNLPRKDSIARFLIERWLETVDG